jgi:hypothetical protein
MGGLLTTPKGLAIAGRFVRVGLLLTWAGFTFLTLWTWGKRFEMYKLQGGIGKILEWPTQSVGFIRQLTG